MPDILDIVRDFLNASDFDGIYSEGECACTTDDLAPCGEIRGDCKAGYIQPCDCGDHDWHIGPKKSDDEVRNDCE